MQSRNILFNLSIAKRVHYRRCEFTVIMFFIGQAGFM